MNHPIDPPAVAEALATMDDTLARILTEPTMAHQILTATAVGMAFEPFLLATTEDINALLTEAADCLLSGLPDAVADEAVERASSVVPMPGRRETYSTYAIRLRAAAEGV